MHIAIHARNFDLTDALGSYTERRLRFALTSADNYVQRIVVRLSDINGPKGGDDKRCHVQVMLADLPDVVVEDIEADHYFAIDRAVDRAARTVMRKITRRQKLGKQVRSPTWDAEPSI
jgi:putative sigma-54 modulation protein